MGNLNAFNMFYIAATVKFSSSGFVIKGRALSATAPPGSPGGPIYQLSDAAATKLDPPIQSFNPAVGGDSSANAAHTRFFVAWSRRVGTVGPLFVHYCFVDFQGAPLTGLSGSFGADALDAGPAISPSNAGSEWTLCYVTTDERVMLARFSWNGSLTLAPQLLTNGSASVLLRISSPVNGRHLIALAVPSISDVRLLLAEGLAVLDEAVLSSHAAELVHLDLATDGTRFVLAQQSADFIQLQSVSELVTLHADPLTGALTVAEQMFVPDSTPRFFDGHLASRTESGGSAGRTLFAWSQLDPIGVESDIHAALYKAP